MLLPIVSATLAPASAVPVMAVACSPALMTLSAVTSAMVGTPGATVSRKKSPPVVLVPTLPAASVTVALTLTCPSPRVCTS